MKMEIDVLGEEITDPYDLCAHKDKEEMLEGDPWAPYQNNDPSKGDDCSKDPDLKGKMIEVLVVS